jgi:hypothetical protein
VAKKALSAYAPIRLSLIDKNKGQRDYQALKRGIEHWLPGVQ